ncbi:hypothetical protein BJY01DRAFT_252734 [Aspergillus pseudoustus]|uniref:Fungal N-terminal domain-containing protein n=1 Tax=Aspergillus pseudoustus TaxID=1810923 RepID=A0ABR4J5N3_9EURO
MTDPFSVAGSAVGVASLGLTICQGFLAYYGPYKSFHEDIEEFVSRIENVNSLMSVLRTAVTESSVAVVSGPQPTGLLCLKLLGLGSFMTRHALPPDSASLVPILYSYPLDVVDEACYDNGHSLRLLWAIVSNAGIHDLEIRTELFPLATQSVDDLRIYLDTWSSISSTLWNLYAGWPTGLAILLERGYSPTINTLEGACNMHCFSSIDMILRCERFDVALSALDIATAQGNYWIRNRIIEALVERRERLTSLAERYLSAEICAELNMAPGSLLSLNAARASKLLSALGVDISGLEVTEPFSVYWAYAASLDIWSIFWDSGFTDVNEIFNDRYDHWMWSFEGSSGCEDLFFYFEKVTWLISRGLDLCFKQNACPTINRLGYSLGYFMGLSCISDRHTKLLHRLILDDTPDDCRCPCSVEGCIAFARLLERVWAEAILESLFNIHNGKLSITLSNIDSTLSPGGEQAFYNPIAGSVLCYLTFCELGLTHTCCHDDSLPAETIDEIHTEEAEFIDQLDELVDEFCRAYEESPLTFHQFLTQEWKPRMTEILLEKPSDEDIIELRRVGVTIREFKESVSWRSLLS